MIFHKMKLADLDNYDAVVISALAFNKIVNVASFNSDWIKHQSTKLLIERCNYRVEMYLQLVAINVKLNIDR